MSKNKKIVCGVVGVLILIGAFCGGMIYGKSQNGKGQNMPAFGQNGVSLNNRGSNTRVGGNFGGSTFGKIIAKDNKSITVQIISGGADAGSQVGSRIIFLGTDTTVSKQTSGTLNDLAIGAQVTVRGTANTDGSVNAQSVQIVPANITNQKTPTPVPNVVQ